MHLRKSPQINAINTHAAEYLLLCLLIQSTRSVALTGENYIGVATNI